MIELDEAKKLRDAWQSQGERLLQEFDVSHILQPLGVLVLEGSFTYGLMIKPDIDGRIYSNNPSVEAVSGMLKPLAMHPGVVRTMLVNYTELKPEPGMPVGLYLGIRYQFEHVIWNFDIWITKPEDELSAEFKPMARMDDAQRDELLLLKYQLKESGFYPGSSKIPGSFSSADLYRAVLRDGVATIDDLLEWRKDHPGINQS